MNTMSTITAAITAVGGYVPDFVLTNKILETMVDTNDEWITSRTGIKERRILKDEGKGTSYLAIKASQDLLVKGNINPLEIDLVIVATATPDMLVAATAAYVADVIPEDRRGEAQGSLGIFTATGMSIGPAIGSFLASKYGSDQMFYISSVFALASILILSRMKETLPPTMKSRLKLSLFRIGWKDVFEPKIIPVFWIMLFVSFSAGAMITLIPDTSKIVGWTNKGLYFTIYTVSSIIIRFFFSKASDQYGRIPVLIFGCFMLSISMFLLVFSANSYLMIISAIIYGVAWGFNTPTLAAWTNDLGDKKHMGRAMATMYIALEAGIGIGAYVSGEIYQGIPNHIPIPFLIAGLLSLLAFLLLWKKKQAWTYGI